MLRLVAIPALLMAAGVAAAIILLAWPSSATAPPACRTPVANAANLDLAEPLVYREGQRFARGLGVGPAGAGLRARVDTHVRGALVVEIEATAAFGRQSLMLALAQRCDGGRWRVIARQTAG